MLKGGRGLSYRYLPKELLEGYDQNSLAISAVASHSALDVFDGAKDEGIKTLAICEKGREVAYLRFRNVIDDTIILNRFSDLASPEVVKRLRERGAIIVPNRSFAVYVGYEKIEEGLPVPIFGNRYILRYEERTGEKNYYKLLDAAGIRRPKTFSSTDEIDRPVIVKMPHAKKRVERGFFVARDRDDFWKRFRKLVLNGVVVEEDLKKASIEELVVGAHFNVNYFRTIARKDVELLSIDRRIQTNLDGFLRLPSSDQIKIEDVIDVEYVEIGHEAATIRERMLNKLFEIGDRFVGAVDSVEPPGVIGPFTLQLMVTPDLDVVVFDVALRIGGGTNIYMGLGSQYSKLYFGSPISMGRRIAIEVKECVEKGCFERVIT